MVATGAEFYASKQCKEGDSFHFLDQTAGAEMPLRQDFTTFVTASLNLASGFWPIARSFNNEMLEEYRGSNKSPFYSFLHDEKTENR